MTVRSAIKYLLPYGIVQLFWQRARTITPAERQAHFQRQMAARARQRAAAAAQVRTAAAKPYSYAAALAFLDAHGVPPDHAREGSVPLEALEFMRDHLDRLAAARPLLGLHVGNFVGMSLAFMAEALCQRHPDSKVISIDPNVTHRGIARPADVTLALLVEFGLEDRVAILQGYSLEKNVSNYGRVVEGYDPIANWQNERACTEQLPLLRQLCPGRIDVCLLDGNHDDTYLRRELTEVASLLRSGGLLVLDDVADPWPEIQAVFADIGPEAFAKLGTDGRIGVLMKR